MGSSRSSPEIPEDLVPKNRTNEPETIKLKQSVLPAAGDKETQGWPAELCQERPGNDVQERKKTQKHKSTTCISEF